MPVRLGTTLRCQEPPRHIWIVISDPDVSELGAFVFVNLTSMGGSCAETACILDRKDYSLLSNRSTVAYSRSHVGFKDALEDAIGEGYFRELPPVPPRTLDKIIAGAHSSPHISPNKRLLLPD